MGPSIGKTRKTEIIEYLFLKYSWKFMDMISHSEWDKSSWKILHVSKK